MMVQTLGSELELHVCSDKPTADKIARFCGYIFRPPVEDWARSLLSGAHPTTHPEHFIYVCDARGEIVSSLCMILQTWRFESVSLKVGQIELVGTDAAWRRRGLIRAQMSVFDDLLREHGCALSCVQGLAGVYQRLGYDYAIPLKGGVRLWVGQIAAAPIALSGRYTLRPAEPHDVAKLVELYEREMQPLMISSVRDAALWHYQESQPAASEHAYETYVIERGDRVVTGYFRLPHHCKSPTVIVRELSVDSYDAFLMVLDFAKRRARQAGFDTVTLQLPETSRARHAARYLGAQELDPFAWQVRVFDWPELFRQISPVLEQRLADSLLTGWTGTLPIRLIESGMLRLTINNGKTQTVEFESASVGDWFVEAPAGLLCQLVMGYRSSEELQSWHPDFQVRAAA
ncbi:MAG TPA: GNAT family N-acetyltransferase, partial [Pyrinomonadaceae bacterium]